MHSLMHLLLFEAMATKFLCLFMLTVLVSPQSSNSFFEISLCPTDNSERFFFGFDQDENCPQNKTGHSISFPIENTDIIGDTGDDYLDEIQPQALTVLWHESVETIEFQLEIKDRLGVLLFNQTVIVSSSSLSRLLINFDEFEVDKEKYVIQPSSELLNNIQRRTLLKSGSTSRGSSRSSSSSSLSRGSTSSGSFSSSKTRSCRSCTNRIAYGVSTTRLQTNFPNGYRKMSTLDAYYGRRAIVIGSTIRIRSRSRYRSCRSSSQCHVMCRNFLIFDLAFFFLFSPFLILDIFFCAELYWRPLYCGFISKSLFIIHVLQLICTSRPITTVIVILLWDAHIRLLII